MQQYLIDKTDYDAENKGKSKGERGVPPAEPQRQKVLIGGNVTAAALKQQLATNGGWGILLDTELDSASAMLKSESNSFSTILRQCAHHETVDAPRATYYIPSIESPRLSALLTGTPGQLSSFFQGEFENGLGSRFLFYELIRKELKFNSVFDNQDFTFEDLYREFGKKIYPLYIELRGRTDRHIQFIFAKEQQKRFYDMFQGLLEDNFNMLGDGMIPFILRIALAHFRIAMVLSVLRQLSDWQESSGHPIFETDSQALLCDERDYQIASIIIEQLIEHTARVYDTLKDEQKQNPFERNKSSIKQYLIDIYNKLPEGEFTTAQFHNIVTTLLHVDER